MKAPWFFATTPIPRRVNPQDPHRHGRSAWHQFKRAFVAWAERSRLRHGGSITLQ
ncbi:hypothetical protein [Piscinibacter terrae]|uniref:hypothetical protein n=1 Tax=Piscinibacter terrae TaxID=2496871 RepID=UPI00138664C8|nr:hypothetical protein [Albitalea terrae]